MTENFKVISSFIKDMSSETPDAQTFIFVKDKISKYRLNIDINSRAVKNGIIEVDTILKFTDQPEVLKKSHFEINYATIVKIDENVKEKKELEKMILCDVQIEIYSDLEKALLDLLHNSGYPAVLNLLSKQPRAT